MKSYLIIIIVVPLLIGHYAVRAQEAMKKQSLPEKITRHELVLPGDPFDPKISAEQREIISNAGSENPSKPKGIPADQRSADYGVNPETYCGQANAKPVAKLVTDPLKEEEARSKEQRHEKVLPPPGPEGATPKSSTGIDQPEGIKPVKAENFRNINGPDTQPSPPVVGKIINYREIKGPDTQPEGEQPKR